MPGSHSPFHGLCIGMHDDFKQLDLMTTSLLVVVVVHSYFKEPWAMAIFHDRFSDFRDEVRELLISRPVCISFSLDVCQKLVCYDMWWCDVIGALLSCESRHFNQCMPRFMGSVSQTWLSQKFMSHKVISWWSVMVELCHPNLVSHEAGLRLGTTPIINFICNVAVCCLSYLHPRCSSLFSFRLQSDL